MADTRNTAAPLSAAPDKPAPVEPSTADGPVRIIGPDLLERQAREHLPEGSYEYIAGGAGDEWTLRANRERLMACAIHARRLTGHAKPDPSATMLGRQVPAPLYVAPMGAQDFAHIDADCASAAGAARAGVPFALSSASNKSIEEAAAAGGDGPRYFAIYLNEDWDVNYALVERAKRAGYEALIMTVDSAGPGVSERYLELGGPATRTAGYGNYDPRRGGTGAPQALQHGYAADDVGRLKDAAGLPVLVKGVVRPDDAQRIVAAGADGVIVSNHGGRTLDGLPAALDLLAPVVEAAGGRVPVWFDSGVRRGQDVIRALALGADAVGVGRPLLYALALGGAAGAHAYLSWLVQDIAAQMAQAGAADLGSIDRGLVSLPPTRSAP